MTGVLWETVTLIVFVALAKDCIFRLLECCAEEILFSRREAVRLLLTDSQLSVKEIAARTGYARPLNFSAEFRKRFGCSPRMYRKRKPYQLF